METLGLQSTFNETFLIVQFNIFRHPSQDQRREVCISLISKYPGQQDATGGYVSALI